MREMGQIEYDGLVKVSRADAVRNINDACSLPVRLKPELFEGTS